MIPQTSSNIETIAGINITDFRKHQCHGTESPSSDEARLIPKIPARDFLRDLASMDVQLYRCTSQTQLVGKLNQIAESFDTSATFGSDSNTQRTTYCANRDNTYQLIELLY